MRALLPLLALAACAVPDTPDTSELADEVVHPHRDDCGWGQWAQSPTHDGAGCSSAQPMNRLLARRLMDPFTSHYAGQPDDAFSTHYQVPLTDGDDNVFIEIKSGAFTAGDFSTENWSERRMHWQGGQLVDKWQFDSDWKPAPFATTESMFHPALHDDEIWIPGAHGSVYVLNKRNGHVRAHYEPFGTDIDTWLVGGIAISGDGDVYYNALQLAHTNVEAQEIRASWLVHVKPNGNVSKVSYTDLVPRAPGWSSLCYTDFSHTSPRPARPWPPPPNPDGTPRMPAASACGAQRAAVNAIPAIADDGTVYVVSRAHHNGYYGYLVAVKGNLTPKWAASLRERLADGCGVLDPYCSVYGAPGVDESTNQRPAGQVVDYAASSPVVLPDHRIIVGGYTVYNDGRGHTFAFTKQGAFDGAFDFGWDVTPAVYRHDGTYSIIIKDNYYFDLDNERYLMSQLDPAFQVEWSYRNPSTLACEHDELGNITCYDDGFINGYEWCMDAPAVDADGNVYGTSEDGYVYGIAQGGTELGRFFLDKTRGAAYTPAALDPRGRIYAMNNGELFVIGQ